MTGKEICQAYARFRGVPEAEVESWAKQFWEQSPTGELYHVHDAAMEMARARVPGFEKYAASTCTCLNVIPVEGADNVFGCVECWKFYRKNPDGSVEMVTRWTPEEARAIGCSR